MTPRATLAADRYSADQLVLTVKATHNPAVFDLAAYDQFIDAVAGGRDYQREAICTVLRYFCGREYQDTAALAREAYAASPDLQRRYATADALVARLPFAGKLAGSLDLATGTGKSYAMYAIARIMLNEALVDRVLVLCPSLTIEAGLWEKFNALTADGDLTDLLPSRDGGHPLPTVVDGTTTVKPGDICIENRHAAYENAGSSLGDSFRGRGDRTLVISDEAHHVVSGDRTTNKKWHDFLADPNFGFRWHLGVSGTCYVQNEYFTDVIFRYALRDAINDGWVKEVFYLKEDDSRTDDERFQKLLQNHEKNRQAYKPVKPLTIAVTRDIKAAEQLAADIQAFLARQPKISRAEAAGKVLVVTSDNKHKPNVARLRSVDDATDPVEWIVSVSMLTEGWDVHNVFQIYPHQKRAFDSKLLVSQVLGRGLRRPEALPQQPVVYVFNHQAWGPEVDEYVAEVLDQDSTIAQRPAPRNGTAHFEVHQLDVTSVPQAQKKTKLVSSKKLLALKLVPQMDAEEKTRFVSATSTRAATLVTKVVEQRYPVEDVVGAVRQRLLDHDQRHNGTLAKEYPKDKVRKMITDGLRAVKAKPNEVTQENRQRLKCLRGSPSADRCVGRTPADEGVGCTSR